MIDSDVSGMTVNERLFHFGLLDAFDRATVKGDRTEMIALFHRVHIPSPDADRSVDIILADPTRYGRMKR